MVKDLPATWQKEELQIGGSDVNILLSLIVYVQGSRVNRNKSAAPLSAKPVSVTALCLFQREPAGSILSSQANFIYIA